MFVLKIAKGQNWEESVKSFTDVSTSVCGQEYTLKL